MKRKTGQLENFFNLNRYKKRRGAKAIRQSLNDVDFETLKSTLIDGERPRMFQSYMIKNLNDHMRHLRTAFHGQPELLFYHAQLIVLIRREADLSRNYADFKLLWTCESDFLLEHLNMRWLIAAVDTFIDHDPDETVRAIMLNAVMMINTIKLYETERHLLNIDDTDENDYDDARLTPARRNCFNLFDELPSFRIGIDDTLRNMCWRLDAVSKQRPLAGKILKHIFERVNNRGIVSIRGFAAVISNRGMRGGTSNDD